MIDRLTAYSQHAVLAATALAAFSLTSCNLAAGAHDATTEFLVAPGGDGTYFGWSEITISQDARSVNGATLEFARLELPDDSPAKDLTFIQNISGELVTPTERVPAAKKDTMPAGDRIVLLDVLYDGDLRRFFPDGHTVRIEWKGSKNPAAQIPQEGLWVNVRIRVNVE